MTKAELAFPVIGFSQGTMMSFENTNSLTTCTRKGMNWYTKLIIVDSEGFQCEVKGAESIKGRSWAARIISFLTGKMAVEPIFINEMKKIELEAFKNMVCVILTKDAGFFSETMGIVEFRKHIQEAKSYQEIIRNFL